MHTLLIVPDGTGVRNYLCSSFIDEALARGPVTVWHALPPSTVAPFVARFGTAVRFLELPSYAEPLDARLLRQAKIFAQLAWQDDRDGSAVVMKFLRPPRRLRPRLLRAAALVLGKRFASARGVAALHRWHARWALGRAPSKRWRDAVSAIDPDVVFCAHQRSAHAVAPMIAARRLGIPTATFVYSWDNLPKGRMAVHADHVLVWSDFMGRELAGYEPERPAETIHVVGTPQFEPYFDPTLRRDRATFLGELGLDPDRPVVCYSGCDTTSAPHDPIYLADLAAACRRLPAERRPQILLRPSPADPTDRFDAILEAFPEIAVSKPRWSRPEHDQWASIVPEVADIALLANVVHHADAVVNVGSTMAMDFAIEDKPAIFIAYDPPGAVAATTLDDSYALPHFRAVKALDPVLWARDASDLEALVPRLLEAPGEKASSRRAWVEQQVRTPLDQASRRTVEALATIAETRFGSGSRPGQVAS